MSVQDEIKAEFKSEVNDRREKELSQREINLLAKENGMTVEDVTKHCGNITALSFADKEAAIKKAFTESPQAKEQSNRNMGREIAEKYGNKKAKSSYFRY